MNEDSLDDKDGFIWFNGEFVNWRDAKIHPLTHGLHYGSSVFEGERAYWGKIFKSTQHSKRLINSAKLLDFKLPYTVDELEKAKAQLLIKNKLTNCEDCYIRAFAFLGSNALGLAGLNSKVNTVIAAWRWGAYFGGDKMKGLRFDMADYRRPSNKTIPSSSKAAGNYMICTISKNRATKNGYDDALMLDYRGYVAEATAANVFFYMPDGKLHTPTPDAFLNGITRQTIIELAKNINLEVVERHMTLDDINQARECFVTGTAAEIMPVSEIKGGYNFTPDKICASFVDAYDEVVRKN